MNDKLFNILFVVLACVGVAWGDLK